MVSKNNHPKYSKQKNETDISKMANRPTINNENTTTMHERDITHAVDVNFKNN